jgi:hypothetical protein
MNLQNGYKVIYEKIANGERTFFADNVDGTEVIQLGEAIKIGQYKLVFEKDGKIYGSETGKVEDGICLEAFNEVFTDAEEAPVEEEPEQEAHPEAISTNGDSHGELTVDGGVVTLNVTGTIEPATNPNGNTYHHVGFKITAPAGIDPANVIITRPDGKTRIMANILDGDNYTNMYWKPTENDRVFTYYIDWNNDGVNDLTVIIDASKAILNAKPEVEPAAE